MAAKLRLWRVPDFEKCKKVRNLPQKSENSEHFGGPEETRTLDLSDANRTLSQSGKFSANGLRCMVCQKLIIQHLQKQKFAMAFSINL